MRYLFLALLVLSQVLVFAQKPQFISKPHAKINVSNAIRHGAFALIDLDQDGDEDLAVEHGQLFLYENLGDGSFQALPQPCALQTTAVDIQVVDLSADGDQDLVVNTGSDRVLIIENLGNLRFERRQDSLAADLGVDAIETGDLNADGFPDLVVSGNNSQYRSELRILFGDSVRSCCLEKLA